MSRLAFFRDGMRTACLGPAERSKKLWRKLSLHISTYYLTHGLKHHVFIVPLICFFQTYVYVTNCLII